VAISNSNVQMDRCPAVLAITWLPVVLFPVPVKFLSCFHTCLVLVLSLFRLSLATSSSSVEKKAFPDNALPSPEGLVKLIRFIMGSRNERCRGVGTSGLEHPQSLSLKIAPDADRRASGRVLLHLRHWHSISTRFSICNTACLDSHVLDTYSGCFMPPSL
jgi:hypothetical protein